MIGRTLGNYVVQKKIGSGGMGTVYLAEHPKIRRRVAIKVLRAELADDPEAVSRFFTEARSANEIRNEHIIDILDLGEAEDGRPYLIMEWLDGQSLQSYLAEEPRPPLDRTVHVLAGIADALVAAHARGIIHRDLKPDNVFLVTRGHDPWFAKVLDFGIAKLLKPDAGAFQTANNALVGTPAFMSPEQCQGGATVDPRSDIYSLGVILYRMATGRLPFAAESTLGLLVAHTSTPPPPPQSIEPSIPEAVEVAILRALEKDPDRRFQHAEELIAAIAAGAGVSLTLSLPIPAEPDQTLTGAPESVGPPSQRGGDTLGSAAAESVKALSGPSSSARSESRRRAGMWTLGALGFLAAGVFGQLAMRGPKDQRVGPPPGATASTPTSAARPAVAVARGGAAPAPAPVAAPAAIGAPGAAAAAGSGPAMIAASPSPARGVAAAADTVEIKIRTAPARAEVLLDEAPLANPFVGRFPKGDLRHRLSVRAPGYRAQASWQAFDRDRSLEVTLEKEPERRPGPHPAHTAPVPAPKAPAEHAEPELPQHTDDVFQPGWGKDDAAHKKPLTP